MEDHVLTNLLLNYYHDFRRFKSANVDLDNVSFNRTYGLLIKPPVEWPIKESIVSVIKECNKLRDGRLNASNFPKSAWSSAVIIYSSSKEYKSISEAVPEEFGLNVNYFSWHELYVAMDRSNKDARDINHFRTTLGMSKLTIFWGAPEIPELLDQVRSFCSDCLIIFQG